MLAYCRGKVNLAAESVEVLVANCADGLRSDELEKYLQSGFVKLCRAISLAGICSSDQGTATAARRIKRSFALLDAIVHKTWMRFDREPSRSLKRAELIVGAVFKPDAFSEGELPSVWKGKVTSETYRQLVVERVCEAIHDPLVGLRNELRALEMLSAGAK